MMFRYESGAFTQTADLLQTICGEFDQYEERIRNLSRQWERNPDMPAPRERLRRALGNLEQKETSLNLMRRKLESAARVYEDAERRALDIAGEMEPSRTPQAGPSAQGSGSEGGESHGEGTARAIRLERWPILNSIEFAGLIEDLYRKKHPKYPAFTWLLPSSVISEVIRRYRPAPPIIQNWSPRPPRPFTTFPPQKPKRKEVVEILKCVHYDRENTLFRLTTFDGKMTADIQHPVLKPNPVTSLQRQERRSRITRLFTPLAARNE